MEKKIGKPCSVNFVFKKQLKTFEELYEVLKNEKSIFWRHRPFPSAVIMQQKLCVIESGLKYGVFWQIEESKFLIK